MKVSTKPLNSGKNAPHVEKLFLRDKAGTLCATATMWEAENGRISLSLRIREDLVDFDKIEVGPENPIEKGIGKSEDQL